MAGQQLTHLFKFLIGFAKPQTQTTEKEICLLRKYAARAQTGVEIGVFEGCNTVEIAKVMEQSGRLFAVDPFLKGRLGICYYKLIAKKHIGRNNVKNRVVLIEAFSADADNRIPDGVDFIFIDGDHSWEGIRNDWEIYSKKLRKNGIIALHDTRIYEGDFYKERSQLESVKFFNEIIANDSRFELIEVADSLSIMRKKQ